MMLKDRRVLSAAVVLALVASFLFAGARIVEGARDIYENAAYRIMPSAARAYTFGERHFNAKQPQAYDIDRAEYFFDQALTLDPRYPLLQFELARVEFLRGEYALALERINLEIKNNQDAPHNAHYVRGLIEGYMGRYDAAIGDYATYLLYDPQNWAAINDYAWVLLKAGRAQEAASTTTGGLTFFPDNPWLLNSNAIALYESGQLSAAEASARRAVARSSHVSEREWLTAYPGNDPRVARIGIETLQRSAVDNMHTIELAVASSTVQ